MLADYMLELLLVPLTDPRWIELFEELELDGSVLSKKVLSPKAFEYSLSKLGVRLYTDANGWVMTVHFLVGPERQCDLPFGLRPGCKSSDVHQLIGSPRDADPVQKRESFSFECFHVTIFYSLEDETLESVRVMRTGEGHHLCDT